MNFDGNGKEPKRIQGNSWPLILIALILLCISLVGVQKYEHIDHSFWRAFFYCLLPIPSAYFILWHYKNNSHKKRSHYEYSMIPGIIGAVFLGSMISIPFSGLLLVANAVSGISIISEQVYLVKKWESGKFREFDNIQVDRIERGGSYEFDVSFDLYVALQPGERYLMKYKRGMLGIRYLDSEFSLRRLGKLKGLRD